MNRFSCRFATTAVAVAAAASVFAQAPVSPTLARNLAAQCANCHGTNGRSVAEVPSLAGQAANVLIEKMNDYRSGKRAATIMHQLSKGYTDEQIALVADYFSKQPK
jgi:cytochrome c553